MIRRLFFCAFALFCAPNFAGAQGDGDSAREDFVTANIIAIFYHELGHALIDKLQLSVLGQEEDAADVLSVIMIDWIFEEESAQGIAIDSAFGFLNDPENTQEVAYWDVHGPDEQRFYNHVCLFYGANPDARAELAKELELPEERAEGCPDEFALAADSWGTTFDAMEAEQKPIPMVFEPAFKGADDLTHRILKEEVAQVNQLFKLPAKVTVTVEDCDEANAFYIPEESKIVMCSEFAPYLEEQFDKNWTK